jgi:predicted transcriptional regulator
MFRSTEAMLANVIAVFVGNAPMPQDDLLKVQDLSELQNLYNMTDKQKEQLLHAQQSCLSNLKSSMLKDMQIVFDYQLQYAHCI